MLFLTSRKKEGLYNQLVKLFKIYYEINDDTKTLNLRASLIKSNITI